MEQFLGKDFLLRSETARLLYHTYAEPMPIYDYHCHLSPKEIYEDRKYESITDLWLVEGTAGDHYKWRALRANGVSEEYITGTADKREKFRKWAETIPYTVGNPLFHWTHLEMKRFFGIDELLNAENADRLYDRMNRCLQTLTARKIIEMANVDTICTTDDPADDLHYHRLMAEDPALKVHVYPAFRPDKIINIDWDTFRPYVKKLEEAAQAPIRSLKELEGVLERRIAYFHECGCRISDHALDEVVFETATEEEVADIFLQALEGKRLSLEQVAKYKGYLLVFLGRQYHRFHWVQQYHIKAQRNNNSRMMGLIGPDTGFDAISDRPMSRALSCLLDALDRDDRLPKTILYSLDPGDNEILATLAYCFQKGTPGKMQLGSGWWFLDQKDGMQKQLTALSHLGLLSRFVGMLTDSRSFLSYTRHEYFRRVLCNFLGDLVENGEYPNDISFLGEIVKDICFRNAKRYFDEYR